MAGKRTPEVVRPEGEDRPGRRNRVNFFELAYLKIEDLLVSCELRPGQFLTVLELQHLTGLGRTPIHHAVNRLSADTLIIIRPRHGLQIAPIDLARDRMLLGLRRDMERFVIRLAADRASLSHRNQALHIERLLRERRATLTLDEFNNLDRRIDALILEAGGEPFLAHTMRPLHTLYRRIGFIHHRHMPGQSDLSGTLYLAGSGRCSRRRSAIAASRSRASPSCSCRCWSPRLRSIPTTRCCCRSPRPACSGATIGMRRTA